MKDKPPVKHTRNWHSAPSEGFREWWEPYGFDSVTGASIGGHPDAWRVWARKDPDGYRHREYGTSTLVAWNTARYLLEFNAWLEIGAPEHDEPFVSNSAPVERQKAEMRKIAGILAGIGKTVVDTGQPQTFQDVKAIMDREDQA